MSWSVSAIGKAGAVRTNIQEQFAKGSKCMEPEESVRQAAAKLVDAALAGQDPNSAVKISASGSQSFKDYTKQTGVSNTLSIVVDPCWNFVE